MEITYIILIFVLLIFILAYFFENRSKLKVKSVNQIKVKDNMVRNVLLNLANVFVPKPDLKILNFEVYKKYHYFLRYLSTINVEKFFRIKFYIALSAIVMLFLVQKTNISINIGEVYKNIQFRLDPIYVNTDRILTKEQEMDIFNTEIDILKKAIDGGYRKIVYDSEKSDAEVSIKNLITNVYDEKYGVTRNEMANRIYYRILAYNKATELNMQTYIMIVLMMYFIPEVIVWMYNFFAAVDAKKELRFLKKLIIMNGSIKPVDFMDLLKELISKSKYHKTMLKDIEDLNKRNYVDNTTIYRSYIQNAKDINVKLFYEKLDEANNYDFDQAILNIKNEFELEKRVESRDIRKKIEFIHTMGVTGFMVLTLLAIMYMLVPWLATYEITQFSF